MFMRGFVSSDFRLQTPKYWSSRLSFFLLKNAHDLWKQRCHDNNSNKQDHESSHVKNRMRAKVSEVYDLAAALPKNIQDKFLPVPMEEFLQSHPKNSILLWYPPTKAAISASLRRFVLNDASRLSPNHPINVRVPPDGQTVPPLSHLVPQV
jgi:hypothetical protein